MPVISSVFSRIWKFVDHRSPGDEVTRLDLDTALDDFVPAINGALAIVGDATTQAGIATTQAGVATSAATTATTQAGIATTQAGIATTQAGIATGAAADAQASAIEAAAASDEAAMSADQAEEARDATLIAALGASVFPNTGAGIAGTILNDLFWVPTGEDAVLYKHEAGPVATDTGLRLPLSASMALARSTLQSVVLGDDTLYLTDFLGWVRAQLSPAGDLTVAGKISANGGIDLGGSYIGDSSLIATDHPVFSLIFCDPNGFTSFAIERDTGKVVGVASGGGETTVDFAYAEVWNNASRTLAVSYVCDNSAPRDLLYREVGATKWERAVPFYSREIPLTAQHIHTAIIQRAEAAGRVYEIGVDGTAFADTVSFLPKSGLMRGAYQSDWQVLDYAIGSATGLICTKQAAQACDYIAMIGDFPGDEGRLTQSWSTAWLSMMKRTAGTLRLSGAIIPMAATHGNHECFYAPVGGGAFYGGAGTGLNYTSTFFTWAYHPDSPTRFCDGAAYFTAEDELLILAVDTDHAAPVDFQTAWVETILKRYRRNVFGEPVTRRCVVIGHAPAFCSHTDQVHSYFSQGGALRNEMWPLFTLYNVDAYVYGHTHAIAVNDLGITMTGAGPYDFSVGAGPITFGGGPIASLARAEQFNRNARNAANTDDMFTHFLGDWGGTVYTKGSIVSPPVTPDMCHAWTVETDAAGLRAKTVAAYHAATWISLDTGA